MRKLFLLLLVCSAPVHCAQSARFKVPAQQDCLARTIYHESRGKTEPYDAKLQIGKLVLRRADTEHFPDSICGVVKQSKQFEWVGKGVGVKEYDAWIESVALASLLLRFNNYVPDKTNGALFFHLHRPPWMRGKVRHSIRIGSHEFVAIRIPK